MLVADAKPEITSLPKKQNRKKVTKSLKNNF